MSKTTLVNDKKNPPEYTTSNPSEVTQLLSEGYAVREDGDETGSNATVDQGATGTTGDKPAKGAK